MNINTEYIEEYIEEYGDKVKAIIPVHHAGLPADIDEITKFQTSITYP
ncbi:MAG: DegT/DnrJ/EryC1/StrS family aminotransferase [Ignavibacteria bacterium]|nr:DegT/DnrJ/EryC1/StrS family aminotransferase [Ignavibacteria bacterium]